MIPHIIHLTTRTGTLSRAESLILRKNKKIFKDWEIRIYSDEANRNLIAQHFPEFLLRYDEIPIGVLKADIVRCLYLYLYGGLYMDTDYQFFKPIPKEWLVNACVLPTEHFELDGTPFLGNCMFFSEKDYPFWINYVRNLFETIDFANKKEDEVIACTGPGGITRFYLNNRERYPEICYTPKDVFHPLIINHGLGIRKSKETVGAHFCFGIWRSKSNAHLRKFIYTIIQYLQAFGFNVFNF